MDGLDIGRVEAVVVERFAQKADHLEKRGLCDKRVGPRGLEEGLFGHDRSRLTEKGREDTERARGKRDLSRASPQPVIGVKPERTERNLQKFRLSSGNLQDVPPACAQL